MGTSEEVSQLDVTGMVDAQVIHGDGGLNSTDESSQWTQVRASNESLSYSRNALVEFDPSTVSMSRKLGEGGQITSTKPTIICLSPSNLLPWL